MNEKEDEIPITSMSNGTTEGNLTGSWRTSRPFYDEKISPCSDACPVSQNIPKWMNLLRKGETKKAWEALIESNPLPWTTSKVCQGFCEIACNRNEFDECVSINKTERFLGKYALDQGWSPKEVEIPMAIEDALRQRKKIAIIGSGPAGLSCAYQLGRQGHSVTIFEALSEIGGLLKAGIPEFRLPNKKVDREIDNNILKPFDIAVKISHIVDNKEFIYLRDRFDAVFVATGLHKCLKLGIPGEDAEGVIYGLDFLKKVNLGQVVELGERVVIIGDVNTAIDSAHCAQLLGKDVIVFCEKNREEIPKFLQMGIKAVEKNGAKFFFSEKAVSIYSENNRVNGITVENAEKNRKFFANINNVIIATGEEPNLDFINYESAFNSNVFFGGDVITRASNVAAAIGSGRKVAEKIALYLESGKYHNEQDKENKKMVGLNDLNLNYFEHSKRSKKIIDAETAIKEANRCFSCGSCMDCGNCERFCPDLAVYKNKEQYDINYDYCKGCLICKEECPCGVISSELETEAIERKKNGGKKDE